MVTTQEMAAQQGATAPTTTTATITAATPPSPGHTPPTPNNLNNIHQPTPNNLSNIRSNTPNNSVHEGSAAAGRLAAAAALALPPGDAWPDWTSRSQERKGVSLVPMRCQRRASGFSDADSDDRLSFDYQDETVEDIRRRFSEMACGRSRRISDSSKHPSTSGSNSTSASGAHARNMHGNMHGQQPPDRFAAEMQDPDVRMSLSQGRLNSVGAGLASIVEPERGPSMDEQVGLPGGKAESAARRAHRDEGECAAWKRSHPCILANFSDFNRQCAGKRIVVFLDYDGTLTPIVNDPDRAFLSPEMRETVSSVAKMFPTAIISGRGRDKVEKFVQLRDLYYAGSHGLDIKGPVVPAADGSMEAALPLEPAVEFLETMHRVHRTACAAIASIPGASVEDNKFSVSVHFRNCAPEDHAAVAAVVQAIVSQHPTLYVTRGRKVLELRPKVDWDKGKALLHLVEALGLDGEGDVLPLYIGDDRTDEDAFRVLRGYGVGILVSTKVKPTEASYTLSDPSEVGQFLEALVEWGEGAWNKWHEAPECVGWRARAQTDTQTSSGVSDAGAAAAVSMARSSMAQSAMIQSSAAARSSLSQPRPADSGQSGDSVHSGHSSGTQAGLGQTSSLARDNLAAQAMLFDTASC